MSTSNQYLFQTQQSVWTEYVHLRFLSFNERSSIKGLQFLRKNRSR